MNPGAQIRIAGVIDVFGSAAAHRAIDGPIIVQGEEIVHGARIALPGFGAADALSGVLDDFAASRDGLFGEDAVAVDGRRSDAEPEADMLRIETRKLGIEAADVVGDDGPGGIARSCQWTRVP